MENNNHNQETATQGVKVPNVNQVELWLKQDLGAAIRCLDAVYSDPDMLRSLATFMLGRLTNHVNRPGGKPE